MFFTDSLCGQATVPRAGIYEHCVSRILDPPSRRCAQQLMAGTSQLQDPTILQPDPSMASEQEPQPCTRRHRLDMISFCGSHRIRPRRPPVLYHSKRLSLCHGQGASPKETKYKRTPSIIDDIPYKRDRPFAGSPTGSMRSPCRRPVRNASRTPRPSDLIPWVRRLGMRSYAADWQRRRTGRW